MLQKRIGPSPLTPRSVLSSLRQSPQQGTRGLAPRGSHTCLAVSWGCCKWWLTHSLQSLRGWNVPESVHLSACSWLPATQTCCPSGWSQKEEETLRGTCSHLPMTSRLGGEETAVRRAPGKRWAPRAHVEAGVWLLCSDFLSQGASYSSDGQKLARLAGLVLSQRHETPTST